MGARRVVAWSFWGACFFACCEFVIAAVLLCTLRRTRKASAALDARRTPLRDRAATVFWRGSTTGAPAPAFTEGSAESGTETADCLALPRVQETHRGNAPKRARRDCAQAVQSVTADSRIKIWRHVDQPICH